ncbi:hypothetical protein FQN57_003558 [Myotisia sp. PD_48]|nr:hypothetical protein FQN57_003558 [Myotisia sp. PD_48]
MSNPSIPWRNLYRSLLRECSYLPDPIAAGYMPSLLRRNYRKYSSKESLPPEKIYRLHKRAKQWLSLLRRANEGYQKPLERVIYMAYGRIGKRRWDLLNPILLPHSAQDDSHVIPFSEEWQAPPQLLLLAESQCKHQKVEGSSIKKIIKTKDLSPPLDEENSWGRPIPMVRRPRIRREWYAHLIRNTLPVLPLGDWETLQSLRAGTYPWSPPKRRKLARSPLEPQSNVENYLTAEFLAKGPSKGHTFEIYTRGRPHIITRRFMLRIWQRVASLSPQMTWNSEKDQWDVVWGGGESPPTSAYKNLDPVIGLSFFEGVDQKTGGLRNV